MKTRKSDRLRLQQLNYYCWVVHSTVVMKLSLRDWQRKNFTLILQCMLCFITSSYQHSGRYPVHTLYICMWVGSAFHINGLQTFKKENHRWSYLQFPEKMLPLCFQKKTRNKIIFFGTEDKYSNYCFIDIKISMFYIQGVP